MAIALLCSACLFLLLAFRASTEPFLNGINLPRTHHALYWIALAVLGTVALTCLGVLLQYLLTSPEQNASYIVSRNGTLPPTLMETVNPYYETPTWKYILIGLKSARKQNMD